MNLTDPIFHDEDAAREHFEKLRWPDGAVCPHCESDNVAKIEGKKKSHRPGLYYCNSCQGQFSVKVGTVLERSKIPMAKWALGFHLMAASKKGISAHQLHRQLGITYKTAWFMAHRIREAMGMKPESDEPIGGENKVVESDETYVGGKARNAHKSKPIPKKHAVVTLVERDGSVRAAHVPNVTAKNVGNHLDINVDPRSHLMTDDSMVYVGAGRKFAGHSSVNHSADQYVKLGGFAHVNTAESFHSLVKRGIYGTFHAVSEQHLGRYVSEAAFKWNTRSKLGFSDADRAAVAIKGIEGKRLTYRRTNATIQAHLLNMI